MERLNLSVFEEKRERDSMGHALQIDIDIHAKLLPNKNGSDTLHSHKHLQKVQVSIESGPQSKMEEKCCFK